MPRNTSRKATGSRRRASQGRRRRSSSPRGRIRARRAPRGPTKYPTKYRASKMVLEERDLKLLSDIREGNYNEFAIRIKRGLSPMPEDILSNHREELYNLGIPASPAMTALWRYLESKNADFSTPQGSSFTEFQLRNEKLKLDVPPLPLNFIDVMRLQQMLEDGCIDDDATFTKWLNFVIKAETGKREYNCHKLFGRMLGNVDVNLNNEWYKAVEKARAETLLDYHDSELFTPEELYEIRMEKTSKNAHFRFLKLLTIGKYQDAYYFFQKLQKHGNIDKVTRIGRSLYTQPLDLEELYPLVERVFEEEIQQKARTSFETLQSMTY
jgi:hypothetical protein